MDGTVNLAMGDQQIAQFRVNDRVPITTGRVLTKFDPRSIMNYCSGPDGRTEPVPTAYDMLGMEMLYAINRTYGLGWGVGCFVTTSGLVTSTTGSIVSEWIGSGSVKKSNPSYAALAGAVTVIDCPVAPGPRPAVSLIGARGRTQSRQRRPAPHRCPGCLRWSRTGG